MKIYRFLIGILFSLSACAAPTPVSEPTALPETPTPLPPASTPGQATLTLMPETATSTPASDLFSAAAIILEPPVCDGSATPAQTEGPYYTPNTPERNSLLEEGITGKRMLVVGFVLDSACQPLPGAWLDFWQTDGNGVYDNAGFRMRGHQLADSQGRYFLETVYPGEYPGRTQHIHVKVQASPNAPILTSQLYFPDSASNTGDRIYTSQTLVRLEDRGDYLVAYYNFVLP